MTAVLKIVSDALLAADQIMVSITLLGLLDLSATSHTVDHDILSDHPLTFFGIRGMLIKSFLGNQIQTAVFNGQLSNTSTLNGVGSSPGQCP